MGPEILIVGDRLQRGSLIPRIQDLGYIVTPVRERELAARVAAAPAPAAVLICIGEADADELVDAVRRGRDDVPVILVGSLGGELRDLADVLELGADHFLAAPVADEELAGALVELAGPGNPSGPGTPVPEAVRPLTDDAPARDPVLSQLHRTLEILAARLEAEPSDSERDGIDLETLGLDAVPDVDPDGDLFADLDRRETSDPAAPRREPTQRLAPEPARRGLREPEARPGSTARLRAARSAVPEDRLAVPEDRPVEDVPEDRPGGDVPEDRSAGRRASGPLRRVTTPADTTVRLLARAERAREATGRLPPERATGQVAAEGAREATGRLPPERATGQVAAEGAREAAGRLPPEVAREATARLRGGAGHDGGSTTGPHGRASEAAPGGAPDPRSEDTARLGSRTSRLAEAPGRPVGRPRRAAEDGARRDEPGRPRGEDMARLVFRRVDLPPADARRAPVEATRAADETAMRGPAGDDGETRRSARGQGDVAARRPAGDDGETRRSARGQGDAATPRPGAPPLRPGRPTSLDAPTERLVAGEPLAGTEVLRRLWRLHRARADGRLVVGFRDGAVRQVWWAAGEPVYALGSAAGDGLLARLTARGLLARDEAAEAAARVDDDLLASARRLVRAGLLKPREQVEAVRDVVREVVASLCSDAATRWALDDAPAPGAVDPGAPLPALLARGARRSLGLARMREELSGGTCLQVQVEDPAKLAATLGWPEAAGWLGLLDGTRSLDALVEDDALDPRELWAAACVLTATGLAVAVEPDAGDALAAIDRRRIRGRLALARDGDHAGLLGLAGPDPGRAEVLRAHADLRATFAPERLEPRTRDELAGELAELHAALDEARDVLLDDAQRAAYLAHLEEP